MTTECITTKRRYTTYYSAKLAAERQGHHVYVCEHCHDWHTSKDGRGNLKGINKLPPRACEEIWKL